MNLWLWFSLLTCCYCWWFRLHTCCCWSFRLSKYCCYWLHLWVCCWWFSSWLIRHQISGRPSGYVFSWSHFNLDVMTFIATLIFTLWQFLWYLNICHVAIVDGFGCRFAVVDDLVCLLVVAVYLGCGVVVVVKSGLYSTFLLLLGLYHRYRPPVQGNPRSLGGG